VAIFPSPAEIAAQTPANRDRTIDVIRIVSLVAVVFGHTIMAVSTVRGGVFVWGNLLESQPGFGALTWVLQIMPLFFFAGTAASVESWSDGSSWGGWLMQRCTRLYRPVFFYLAFWGVALGVLRFVLPRHVYEPVAATSIQLLWFLGAYVLVLAATPLLCRINSTARLAAAVAAVYGLIVVIDILRLNIGGLSALGYLNIAVWLIPGMFGVAYRRGLLCRRAAIAVAAVAFVINMLLVWLGPYELSLVGYQGQRLPNMTPPSALLAGHAMIMCTLAIAVAPAISRWAQRPRVWWLVAIGNSGAMTLYLWHMPALLGMHLVFDALRVPRYDMHAPGFIALSVVQVVLMTALVGVLFVALRPVENNPLPGWDGGFVAGPGVRSAAVGTLLCIAGAATLVSVRWGLKDDGLICVAVLLVALIAARALATDSKVPVTAAVTR
jgi:Acyltransferase family